METQSKIHIKELRESMGWKFVREYMEDLIKSSSNKLTIVDPEDSKKITEYQTTIKVLRGIQYFVDKQNN